MALVKLLSLRHKHTTRHGATEVKPQGVGGGHLCLWMCVCAEKAPCVFVLGGVNDEATHLY